MNNFYLGDIDIPQLNADMMLEREDVTHPYMMDGNLVVIPVIGPILRYHHPGWTSTEKLMNHIEKYEALGVDILFIMDTPGGDARLMFELSDKIKNLKVHTISYVESMSASAGFLISSATNHSVINKHGVVGSVGAVIQTNNMSDERLGIKTYTSKISPMKALPPGEERDTEIQKRVDSLGISFVEQVAINRGVTPQNVIDNFGNGATLSWNEAIAANMVDAVGTFEEIIITRKQRMDEKMKAELLVQQETMQVQFDMKMKKFEEDAKANLASALEKNTKEAIASESARIQGIENLGLSGHAALIETMKSDTTVSIEMAAMRLLAAEKLSQSVAAKNLVVDAVVPVPTTTTNTDDDVLLKEFGGDAELVADYQAAVRDGKINFKGMK